jgi:cysteine synthase
MEDLVHSMIEQAKRVSQDGNFFLLGHFNNRNVLVEHEGLATSSCGRFQDRIDGSYDTISVRGIAAGVAKVFKGKMATNQSSAS